MTLSLLCTTDIHGQILSYSYADKTDINKGMSRLSSAVSQLRQQQKLLLIDNGDTLQGTPLNTYNNAYHDFSVMAKAFNALNYDYFNLGNHDFNYGPKVLLRHIAQMKAKCITANILYQNKPLGQSQIIKHENKTIGLIGVVTDYLDHWEKPENLSDFTVLPVIETVLAEVEKLRPQVDVLIVAYHGGFEKDLNTGEPTEVLTGENVGYELSLIDGIDILLTGHQHRTINQMVNGKLTLQAANMGAEFMLVDPLMKTGQLLFSKDYEIDLKFESLFSDEEQVVQNWLEQSIGISDIDLSVDDVFKAQLTKPAVISFENQLLMNYYQADLAFSSLFNDSKGIHNPITLRELCAFYPFPNTYDVIEMDRTTLKAYLEQIAQYWSIENDEIVITNRFLEPKLQMYNYDMGDGLSYTIKISNPIGQRIIDLKLPDKEYFRVVMNNYRSSGGGDYLMIPGCKKVFSDTREAIDILFDYIKQNSPIKVNHIQNIKVIK